MRPEEAEKELRTALRKNSCLGSPSRMTSVSSAYWIMGKSELDAEGIGRQSSPKSLALLITDCNKSAASTKRRGEEDPLV